MGPGAKNLHVLDLYRTEVKRIGELLDMAAVPHTHAGESLSIAQRVELLVGAQLDTQATLRRVK